MNRRQKSIHEEVLMRDHYRCLECGAPATTVHHIISRGRKGAWDVRNMLTLCVFCHQEKNKQAGAHTRSQRVRHFDLLRKLYHYDTSDMGESWQSLIREGE